MGSAACVPWRRAEALLGLLLRKVYTSLQELAYPDWPPIANPQAGRMGTMEQQDARLPVTQKRPYEPPTATFVPLKLEERLLACLKMPGLCGTPDPS